MSEILNVLYTFDENYAAFAGISMYSLFENNRDIENIRVFLAAERLSDKSRQRLSDEAERFDRKVIFVDTSHLAEKIKNLGIPDYRGSSSANFRLFFDLFIPKDVQRLLYLDSDTLVVGSLSPLLTLDMGGKAVGAVRDSLTSKYKTLIGMREDEDYFNTGVLLIDVEAWRAANIPERIAAHVREARSSYANPDQDLLNIVLRGDKYILPPKYNFQPSHRAFSDKDYFSAFKQNKYYTSEELEDARHDPAILHIYRFLGDFPWHSGNLHPDTPVFDKYMKDSLWSEYKKKPSDRGLAFKIEKLLFRTLPRGLFLWLFALISFWDFKRRDRILKTKK